MGQTQMDKQRKEEDVTQTKQPEVKHIQQSNKRIKKEEEDETYVPKSDSSDSEEDDSIIIHSGGSRRDLLINSEALHGSPDLKFRFSSEQKLLLEEQMRMCVQLTTQAYLLSYGRPSYVDLILCARTHLLKMASLVDQQTGSGKKSCFECINLHDALAIVEHFDRRHPHTNDTVNDAKRVICESKVFIYPCLWPQTTFLRPKAAKCNSKINFCKAEDNLIALGLETFGLKKLKKIRENYLPSRTVKEIRKRITCVSRFSRKSFIKHFQEVGELPEFSIEITPFDDTNIKTPVESHINFLPRWMDVYIDIFDQNGPFPYVSESSLGIVVQNNLDDPGKSLCNNIKIEEHSKPICSKTDLSLPLSKYQFNKPKYAINKEINLCQEVCDPKLVNTSSEFAPDLDLELSMSGGIKLSALKRSKSLSRPLNVKKLCRESDKKTSNLNHRSDNTIKLEMDFEFGDLHEENGDIFSKSLTSLREQKRKSSISSPDFSFKQASQCNKTITPYITGSESKLSFNRRDKEKASFKLNIIKLEKESDYILPTQKEKLNAARNDLHLKTSSSEIFPSIKIKEEPL